MCRMACCLRNYPKVKVKASFKNGVREIRLPKTEETKTKEIKVKIDQSGRCNADIRQDGRLQRKPVGTHAGSAG